MARRKAETDAMETPPVDVSEVVDLPPMEDEKPPKTEVKKPPPPLTESDLFYASIGIKLVGPNKVPARIK